MAEQALDALAPYIALSKSATSPLAAIDLITRATSAPDTYVFAELLQTPNIQSLRGTSHDSYLTLLEIFAWGTWQDYHTTPNLPPLTDTQSHKLRLLTLLSLPTPQSLTYPSLLSNLTLPSPHSLETLLISAIYAGLLTATLSPVTSTVAITSIAPLRDLPPNSVLGYISVLSDWDQRCVAVLSELEGEVMDVRRKAMERRKKEGAYERLVDGVMGEEKGKGVAKRAGEEGDEMDVDEVVGRGGSRTAKRGGKFLGRRGR